MVKVYYYYYVVVRSNKFDVRIIRTVFIKYSVYWKSKKRDRLKNIILFL